MSRAIGRDLLKCVVLRTNSEQHANICMANRKKSNDIKDNILITATSLDVQANRMVYAPYHLPQLTIKFAVRSVMDGISQHQIHR